MKYRLISAGILIPMAITAVCLLSPIQFGTVVLFICMLAAWEWGLLSGFMLQYERILLAILCGLLLILILLLSQYYPNIYQYFTIGILWSSLGWWIITLILMLFYPNSAIIWRNSKATRVIFGILTIIPFFCGMMKLRTWCYNTNHNISTSWLLYIMILVWVSDSGAYIAGKLFGKYKLAPHISPNKTWQGCIGGLFAAMLVTLSYSVLVNFHIMLINLMLCSILSVLASVLGDLTESMLKREIGIKDSSNLIPGHGGLLDRIDSLMAAVPVFTILLSVFYKI